MNLYIIEIAGKKYIAAAVDMDAAVKAIMKSLGIEKATAAITTVTFKSAWWMEVGNVTISPEVK